jgi:hypothetical protein|tara:strand:- start:494 stop:991 length:498 start_codon:yes stop_codon:yes gene_type:complete
MAGPQLAVLSVITGVMSAQAQINAGKAQANQLRAEAKQTELQGRVQALNAKREGVSALKNLERVLAANTARQAASNMDPFASGTTPDLIANLNMREGVSQFSMAKSNAEYAKEMSKYQAGIQRTAASNAVSLARQQAFITVGTSIFQAGQIYPELGFTGNQTSTG